MNSASLCSLAGRFDNPIPPRFLAPIDFLKISALATWDGGIGSLESISGLLESLKIRALDKDQGEERGKEVQVSREKCSEATKEKSTFLGGKTRGKK